MLIPDVNVFINVMNEASDHHASATRWLTVAGNSKEALGIPDLVLSSVIRISTGAAMKENQRTAAEAFRFCDGVFSMPAYDRLVAGDLHWPAFRACVLSAGISGRDISDAYLAAFAIENDATFVTFDRGFIRFPDLKVQVLSSANH